MRVPTGRTQLRKNGRLIMKNFKAIAVALTGLSLAITSCDNPSADVAICASDTVTVSDAWTPPARSGQPVSAAYLTICNGSQTDDALVAVEYSGVTAVEIHLSEMNDGVMSMMKVPSLALPTGGVVSFQPGGKHLMLIGITRSIDETAPPEMRLIFEKADPVTVVFSVHKKEDNAEHGGH